MYPISLLLRFRIIGSRAPVEVGANALIRPAIRFWQHIISPEVFDDILNAHRLIAPVGAFVLVRPINSLLGLKPESFALM
jgi:hypothetical protein